ncbi:MAG: hypothetical protein JWM36_3245 [Hyphomicrobiales bacterium]|nr:hypothetical protein [Hyphomicrobiales bacterium]
MSALSRTCLRLAAVAAIRDVTLAVDNVFDSRIGELPTLVENEIKPVVTVFTEEQSGDSVSHQAGGPPFRATVDLIFEIAMVIAQVEATDESRMTLATPATSADMEASLDFIEAQIGIALFESYAPVSVAFRKAYNRIHSASSQRFVQPTAGDRVAMRYVTIKAEVVDNPLLSFDAARTGLARLPAPFAEIAASWALDSPEGVTAAALAAQLAQPTVPLLKSMRVNPTTNPAWSGSVEHWTPPIPPTPAAPTGPVIRQDWTLS